MFATNRVIIGSVVLEMSSFQVFKL